MNKKRFQDIMSGKILDAQPSEIYSVFIKNGKQRAKRLINYYVNNLPDTYTTTKEVVKYKKRLKDIRENEIKNKTLVDPNDINPYNSVPDITSDQDFKEEEEWYYVPKFIKVKHYQKLTKAHDEAYSASLHKQKGVDLLSAHQNAGRAGEDALNKYAQWCFNNNKKLVEKYPDYWSEQRPEEKKEIESISKEKSFFDKVKSFFKNE